MLISTSPLFATKISYKDDSSNPLRLTAPCVLFNSDKVAAKARIASKSFYPMQFDINEAAFRRVFFVKRRTENPFLDDGDSDGRQRSLLVQTGNVSGTGFIELIRSLSGNPCTLAYYRYLCCNRTAYSKHGTSVEEFCTSVLQECLAGNAEMSLPVYLGLRSSIASIEANSSSAPMFAWDYRLMRSYYEDCRRPNAAVSPPMLNVEKVAYLAELVERAIKRIEQNLESNPSASLGCARVFFADDSGMQ
jgi:hypothetical protein